ncbi:MAG: RNA methyltransferase [Acetobacteraceae bacterium]|nr:RNA methyltransferase [Acetobacteraceae bacterium]
MKTDTICGANAVAAVFARRPDAVLRLFYLPAQKLAAGPYCAVLATAKKPYRMVAAEELAKVAGTPHHGGIVAVAKPLVPAILDPADPPRGKMLLVLDGIGNPHNLGAIARSAAFFGVPAMLIGEGLGHAMPSDAALRTAEGGLEHIALFRTRDLPRALLALTPHYRTVAATLDRAAMPLADLPRDRPVALVLGNEETGLSPAVLAACRRQVRISGAGRVQSLNVAQAAAVLLHALCG